MKILLASVLIAALLVLSGCASVSSTTLPALDRPVVTALSPKEVIEIARACYLAHGAKIDPSDDYVLAYHVLPRKRQWTVHFGGWQPSSYAWVVIDDTTRKAEFFPETPVPESK